MCGDFDRPAETDPYEDGMKQSEALLDIDGEGIRLCPMGASCLWHLRQVTSSPTPFYIRMIGEWEASS